jgi:hypothetical protein
MSKRPVRATRASAARAHERTRAHAPRGPPLPVPMRAPSRRRAASKPRRALARACAFCAARRSPPAAARLVRIAAGQQSASASGRGDCVVSSERRRQHQALLRTRLTPAGFRPTLTHALALLHRQRAPPRTSQSAPRRWRRPTSSKCLSRCAGEFHVWQARPVAETTTSKYRVLCCGVSCACLHAAHRL